MSARPPPQIGDPGARAAAHLLACAASAIAARGVFTVALSGGSLPSLLSSGLGAALASAQPGSWVVLLADERLVPLDHADSNHRLLRAELPDIPASSLRPVDVGAAAPAAAAAYARVVSAALARSGGRLDAVFLGLGPDGHTASLFPGHALLREGDALVAGIDDSPKPPPARVTLTLPVINAARSVAFVCTGAGKAPVVRQIFEDPACTLPGALVLPQGELHWFVDAAAAADLA